MKLRPLILLPAIFFFGCSYPLADKEAPLENSIEVNKQFRVALPENHTTGYMWQLNNNFDKKIIDYYGSVFRGNEKGVDFNFRGLKRGKTTLQFALIKYRDTASAKKFIIEIK